MTRFDAMQEKFEEVMVLGRPTLFTDVRIELDTVLDGLYAEWVPYMKAYRLYDACHPQQTVAYEEDTVVAEQRALEEGYSGLVLCDADTMHTG